MSAVDEQARLAARAQELSERWETQVNEGRAGAAALSEREYRRTCEALRRLRRATQSKIINDEAAVQEPPAPAQERVPTVFYRDERVRTVFVRRGVMTYSTAGAAEYLGVHVGTVRRWTDRGELAFYRTPGGQRRFRPEELEAFLRECQRGREPAAVA